MSCNWRIFPTPTSLYQYNKNDTVFVRSKTAKEVGKKGKILAIHEIHNNAIIDPDMKNSKKRNRNDQLKSNLNPSTKSNLQTKHSSSNICRYEIQFTHTIGTKNRNVQTYTKEHRLTRLAPIFYRNTPRPSNHPKSYNETTILLSRSTESYRLMAASQTLQEEQDPWNVLEIGCSYGKCTQILSKYAHHVIAIDTSLEAIQDAKELVRKQDEYYWKKNNVDFRVLDPFMPADANILKEMVRKLSKKSSVAEDYKEGLIPLDCVFIDIGGNRDLVSVVRMINWVKETFLVKLMVVKSEELEKEAVSYIKASPKKDCDPLLQGYRCPIFQGVEWFDLLKNQMIETKMELDSKQILPGELLLNSNKKDTTIKILYAHPLQAPLRFSPKSDGRVPICRYHNYHRNGCRKGNECPFDHSICHLCLLDDGHVAKDCPNLCNSVVTL